MNAVRDDVSHKDVAVILTRKLVGGIDRYSSNAGRPVGVARRERNEPQPVVRLAKTLITATSDDQGDRF